MATSGYTAVVNSNPTSTKTTFSARSRIMEPLLSGTWACAVSPTKQPSLAGGGKTQPNRAYKTEHKKVSGLHWSSAQERQPSTNDKFERNCENEVRSEIEK